MANRIAVQNGLARSASRPSRALGWAGAGARILAGWITGTAVPMRFAVSDKAGQALPGGVFEREWTVCDLPRPLIAPAMAYVDQPQRVAGPIAEAHFVPLPPLPPAPDVPLGSLVPLKATVGVPNTQIGNGVSWSGGPLSLAGHPFAAGIGTCAVSELVYPVKPEYRRFVAVVGIDDAMRDYPQALVVGDGGNGIDCDHADWADAGFTIAR